MRDKPPKLAMLLRRLLETVKDVKQAIHAESKTLEARKNVPPEIRAEVRFDEQTAREMKGDQSQNYRVQNSIRRAAWFAFFAAVIYAGIAAYQACLMRQATIASQQAAEAIRPRLVIAGLTPAPLTANGLPVDQGKLHVSFQVPNYGPVIAVNLRVREFDNVSTQDKIARLPYGQPHSEFAPLVPPVQQLAGNQAPGWGIDGERVLTQDELEGLKEKRLVSTFSILVEYDDAAGRTHRAESCIVFTFSPNWESIPCPWKTEND